jgi:hypothetical protein
MMGLNPWRLDDGEVEGMRQRVRSRVLTRLLAALALAIPFAVLPAAPSVAAPEDLCSGPLAAAEAVQAEIEAHNAQPHVFRIPGQEAALAAYNAEATRLEAEKATAIANLQSCVEAMEALAGAGLNTPDLRTPPQDVVSDINNAKQQIPKNWSPPTGPGPGGYWRAKGTPVEPLWRVLRKGNPGDLGNVTLQGKPRPSVGAPDPAYGPGSGKLVQRNAAGNSYVSPDHIVPLAEIVNLPGFTKLNAQNMYVVTRAPANLQWLSVPVNISKNSRSVALMSGVDAQWQADQVVLENQVRRQLIDIINKLLKSQGA